MTKSHVTTVFLLLMAVGIIGPDWLLAQDSGRDVIENPAQEAASLADVEEQQPFIFFPRATTSEDVSDTFASMGEMSPVESDALDSEPSSDLETGAWDASERFSSGRFLQATPVQYPLDDSAYEGEDPTGRDPEDQEGDWRESSVERPDQELTLSDQPWIEWKKTTFSAQTLPGGKNGLAVTSLDLRGALKFSRWPFLFVTPRAGVHFLDGHFQDGPTTTDLPPQLYDFTLDTTIFLPLNDRWTVQVAAAPSLFTDGKAFKNSFRMVGRGLVYYRWSPELQLAGGFVYLGRKDIVALPAAGFVYTPNEDVKYDIMFPRPKIGYRYTHDADRERWVYLTGELGGGTWAVQRTSGVDETATYRDYQLLFGIEHKETEALNWQLEGGYAFSREIQYLSKIGDVSLPATAVLRMVLSF